MKIFNIIMLFFVQLLSHDMYAQVSVDNVVITGVTIIDANLQTSLTNQTVPPSVVRVSRNTS